ncbi:MAG: D-alanine--D-alanine ligase [Hydrogenothermaceae bacterium]|nr:D-alanine--D-alanine ligase [Hydrogenothermaceae bacterium]
MSNLKIALIYGGTSREREISIKSGKAVEGALKRLGYNFQHFDPIEGKEFIDKIYEYKPNLAFLVLHGKGGEDGVVQSILQFLNIPYTGSDHITSVLAIDKVLTKIVLKHYGINVPEGKVFYSLDQALDFTPDFPVVVKAPTEGSSIGVYIVDNREDYTKAVKEVFKIDEKVLVEQYIKGRELTVSILDGEVYDIVEVKVEDGFYDYTNKYISGKTTYICPAELEENLYREIQTIGLRSYEVLNCRGPARVDIMLSQENTPFVLEINTIPGMTERSLLPKAAAIKGVSFDMLVEKIVRNSLRDRR